MKIYRFLTVCALLSFVLLGCSNQSENASADTATADEKKEHASDNSLSLENDGIDEEEFEAWIDAFPNDIKDKVVTSSVPISEILYKLDITPVGIPTTPYELPDAFDSIPEIGTSMAPDNEMITSLDADLFIGSESVKDSLDDHLQNIDLDTAYLGTDNLDDIKAAVKVLGTYFDKEDKMNTMLEDILSWESKLIADTASSEKEKALLIIGMSDSFMVMNNNTYLGSILERTNVENVAETEFKSEETYAPINMENIVQANPDKIFVLTSGDTEAVKEDFLSELENNEAWKNITAYQEDNIQFLNYDVYGVTSIKNMEEALTGMTEFIDVKDSE